MEKKILIVDDDLGMREMFYNLLSRKGYKVFTCPGGQEAIEVVRKEPLHLILLDAKMPQISGIETLKRIREFDRKTKIVMFTAMDDIELEKDARLHGASGFLRKGLELNLIIKAVDEILEEKPWFDKENNKILIVDDNLEIRNLLEKFLLKKGFNAFTAETGEDALEIVKKEKPIVVLLDIKMPGMDGIVTLKRIKEINENIGVIMITGVDEQNIATEAISLGAYDYLIKPLDFDYLEMCLLTKIFLLTG